MGSLVPGDRDPDETDRLVLRPTARPRDSRGRDPEVAPEASSRPFSHRTHDRLGDRAVLLENVGGHAEHRGLRLVRVRDNATQEIGRRAGHVRKAFGDQSAGTGFGRRHGHLALGQQASDDAFHRVGLPVGVVSLTASVDHGAEPLADRVDCLGDLGVGRRHGRCPCHWTQEVVREAGTKAELDGPILAILKQVPKLLFERRLSQPERREQCRAHHAPGRAAFFFGRESRRDPRQHLLVHHLVELAGHARHREERRPTLPD